MKIRLVVVGGDVKATEIVLRLPAVVGRGKGVNLTVPHPLVSRKHCELYDQDGNLMVRDLESLNGTYVGSRRVTETAVVPAGELLTVGTVNFRVDYGDATTECSHTFFSGFESQSDETPTHKPSEAQTGEEISDTDEVSPSPQASETPPVDRDTEWQLGNLVKRKRDNDDLSSLLDDTR